MYFQFGSIFMLFLLIFIPCFFWCQKNTAHYYFSKIEWIPKENRFFVWQTWLKVIIYTLLVFAMAKPFVYDSHTSQNKKGRDLILALDASGSMAQSGFNSKDRFKTKFETNIDLANDFIKKRFDDNMGVVIFGTFAYTASPLTYDLKTLQYLLNMSNVGIAGESTAIGDALMQSIRTLAYGDAKNCCIILLTDGYHNAGTYSPKQAVALAKKEHIKIYTIGIGSKRDYDVALLETIAKETQAKSYAATSAETLQSIYAEINQIEPSAIRSEHYLNKKILMLFPLGLAFILLLLWTYKKERENQ